jgi:DNA polymerase I-like protein with 3'-5' exonuclease and polymerase domains
MTLTLADYKGIEVRVLAELSQDKKLLEDSIYGDVHAASCAQLFNHDPQWVRDVLASEGEGKYSNVYGMIKEQRTVAKGFSFQLTYGAGPDALSDVLKCTYDEAVEAVSKWAALYPDAYGYRHIMFDAMNVDGFIPTTDGRTIFVPKWDRSMPVAANYPIQSAAASVMYRAVYHTHRLFRERDIPAYLAASVHDELLCQAERPYAEEAMATQIEGMTQGWLDIFPNTDLHNLLDSAIGDTWAAKP